MQPRPTLTVSPIFSISTIRMYRDTPFSTSNSLFWISFKAVYRLCRPSASTTSDSTQFRLTFSVTASFRREQSQMYLWAFDASLHTAIDFCLQIQYLNHHPSHPYSIDAIFEAARWILQISAAQNSSAMPPMHSPSISIVKQPDSDGKAIQTTPERSLAPPATDTGYIKSDELTAMLRSILATIINTLSAQMFQEPPSLRSEAAMRPMLPNSMFSTQRTYADAPALLPAASALVTSHSTPFLTAPIASTTPKLPDEVQTRIDKIEDELCILQAQHNDPTVQAAPNRLVTCPIIISSPSMPLCKIMTALSTLTDEICVLSDANRVSSILSPTALTGQSILSTVMPRRSRSRCSPAQLIPAMQTTTKPSISNEMPIIESILQISTILASDQSSAAIRTSSSQPSVTRCSLHMPLLPQLHRTTPATVTTCLQHLRSSSQLPHLITPCPLSLPSSLPAPCQHSN